MALTTPPLDELEIQATQRRGVNCQCISRRNRSGNGHPVSLGRLGRSQGIVEKKSTMPTLSHYAFAPPAVASRTAFLSPANLSRRTASSGSTQACSECSWESVAENPSGSRAQ